MIARWDCKRVQLSSRRRLEWAWHFSMIVAAVEALSGRSCIIDGEVIACDGSELADCQLLRRRHSPQSQKTPLGTKLQSIILRSTQRSSSWTMGPQGAILPRKPEKKNCLGRDYSVYVNIGVDWKLANVTFRPLLFRRNTLGPLAWLLGLARRSIHLLMANCLWPFNWPHRMTAW
jgi:hypothetical protein